MPSSKYYKQDIKEHKCPICHVQLDTVYTYKLCEKCRQKSREKYPFIKDKHKGSVGRWLAKPGNKEKRAMRRKNYDIAHKEEHRLRGQKCHQFYKAKIYDHYGNKCVCCGESNIKFLVIDHKNNDGNYQRKNKLHPHSTGFYKWIINNNYPDYFQILCANCNYGKRMNNGICPHIEILK